MKLNMNANIEENSFFMVNEIGLSQTCGCRWKRAGDAVQAGRSCPSCPAFNARLAVGKAEPVARSVRIDDVAAGGIKEPADCTNRDQR
jgi:hypothetical protein